MYRLSLILFIFASSALASLKHEISGQYVKSNELDKCPGLLTSKRHPRTAREVRPDDISIVMALGDSISAGLVARNTIPPLLLSKSSFGQAHFQVESGIDSLWFEHRGASYPSGLDPDALSLASLFNHYNSVIGGSKGSGLPLLCPSRSCGRKNDDGLNAAIGGSVSSSLKLQVSDWLLPRLKELEVKDEEWKFVNIAIGGNDLCDFCLTPDTGVPVEHSPEKFAYGIKEAVDHLKLHIPNLIVNIVGPFKISPLYKLKLRSSCHPPHLPLPSKPFECSCALLSGPAGDITRSKMDKLADLYEEAILDLIEDWESEIGYGEDFGVTFQPGSAINLDTWPEDSLSKVDCFHPGLEAHKRVAAGFWNRLTLDQDEKAKEIVWEDDIWIRCLNETDRFPIDSITRRKQKTHQA